MLQGHLAHKKLPPPRTLEKAYAQGPMVVIEGVVISYERGTPESGDGITGNPVSTFSSNAVLLRQGLGKPKTASNVDLERMVRQLSINSQM